MWKLRPRKVKEFAPQNQSTGEYKSCLAPGAPLHWVVCVWGKHSIGRERAPNGTRGQHVHLTLTNSMALLMSGNPVGHHQFSCFFPSWSFIWLILWVLNSFGEVTNSPWLYSIPDKGPSSFCLTVKGARKEPIGSNSFCTPAEIKTRGVCSRGTEDQ